MAYPTTHVNQLYNLTLVIICACLILVSAFENIKYKSNTIANAKSLNHQNEITNLKIDTSLTTNYPIIHPNGTSQPTYYLVTLFYGIGNVALASSSITYLPLIFQDQAHSVVTVFHGIGNFALPSFIYLLILIINIVASLDTYEKVAFVLSIVTKTLIFAALKNIPHLKSNLSLLSLTIRELLIFIDAILIGVTAVIHYIPMTTLLPDAILTPAKIVNDGNGTTYIPEFEPTLYTIVVHIISPIYSTLIASISTTQYTNNPSISSNIHFANEWINSRSSSVSLYLFNGITVISICLLLKSTLILLSYSETHTFVNQYGAVCYSDIILFNALLSHIRLRTSEKQIFYHGVSKIYFTSFVANFCGPTSTTSSIEVATIFSSETGVILELEQVQNHRHLKCFNCSYLSAFGNEDERLFIGGQYKLQFKSILLMDTSENCIYFTKSLSLFDRAINADNLNEIEKRKVSILDYKIVNKLIKCEINDNANHKCNFPDFIIGCFKKFIRSKEVIKISPQHLKRDYGVKFSTLFLHKDVGNLLKFDHIAKIFLYCNEIHSEQTGDITPKYLSELLNMIRVIGKMECVLNSIYLENIEEMPNYLFASLFETEEWEIKKENNYTISLRKIIIRRSISTMIFNGLTRMTSYIN